MGKIAMVDLVGQYQKIESEISACFDKICNSAAFIGGSYVKKFCTDLSEYIDVKHVIPCANGTDALQIALMALELKPGDEVITTPFTFVATVEVIALLGLKPVFADINPETYNIDPQDVASKITSKTKCIIPVHLFGQSADMDAILAIGREHNIPIIEDNAQAIGCHYESESTKGFTGGMGAMGTCSFFPSKNLGCFGDGGAVTTNDDELAGKLRMIANHGSAVRYHHDTIGVNSRLDNLQAAVLATKLPHLANYNKTRKWAADAYNESLEGIAEIQTPVEDGKSNHVYHQYTMRVLDKRNELNSHLNELGIGNAIYYPIPLHIQPAYSYYGFKNGDFPVSELASEQVLSLPIHSEMDEEIVGRVTEAIREFYA